MQLMVRAIYHWVQTANALGIDIAWQKDFSSKFITPCTYMLYLLYFVHIVPILIGSIELASLTFYAWPIYQ